MMLRQYSVMLHALDNLDQFHLHINLVYKCMYNFSAYLPINMIIFCFMQHIYCSWCNYRSILWLYSEFGAWKLFQYMQHYAIDVTSLLAQLFVDYKYVFLQCKITLRISLLCTNKILVKFIPIQILYIIIELISSGKFILGIIIIVI